MGEKDNLKITKKVIPKKSNKPTNNRSSYKDFFKNVGEFLTWLNKRFAPVKFNFSVNPKIKKWWITHKNQLNLLALILAFSLFLVSAVVFTLNLNYILGMEQSRIRYIEEDGIKYIGIEDGYITEKLIVEAGDTLPSVNEYFNPDYVIDEKYTISYYTGDTAITVENFAIKAEDGLLYIIGSNNTLKVKIKNFGKEYESTLLIKDSTAPTIQLEPVTITEGETVSPSSFVAIFVDNSYSFDFTAEIVTTGNYTSPGTYELEIKVCDSSNNCATDKTNLIVEKKKNQSTGGGGNKKPASGTTNPTGGNSSDDDNGSSSGSGGSSGGGGSSSGSGSSGGGTHDGGGASSGNNSTLITAGIRSTVGTYSKENYDLTINYYGTKHTTHYDNVTYTLFDDGFAKVTNFSGKGKQNWDYSGFSNNLKNLGLMKRDAMASFVSDKEFFEVVQSIFLDGSNTERSKKGASKLSINYDLNVIAQIRCYEIVYGNALGHARPGGKTVKQLIKDEYGFKAGKHTDGKAHYGENIAFGHSDASAAISALIASPGHYANIIDPSFKKMGAGALYDSANKRWIRVQIFTS